MTDLVARINEYLSVGGLFNPELMDHEKVRDLLIACRDRLNTAKGANAGVDHPALRQVGASQLHDTESESRHPADEPADETPAAKRAIKHSTSCASNYCYPPTGEPYSCSCGAVSEEGSHE